MYEKVKKNLSHVEFGIRDPEKPYAGSRIQGSKWQRIPDQDPQHLDTG
jgi:hypothetical protein